MTADLNVSNRTIFCRDNLEVLRGINSNCIDLIYLDPPFNKKKTFTAPIGSKADGASFDDIFKRANVKDEWLLLIEHKYKDVFDFINAVKTISRGDYNWCYLVYMAVRLLECRRVLKTTGSLYLHCDSTMSHYLKVLLDCIFRENNFRNEIIWQRNDGRAKGSQFRPKKFGSNTDTLLFYTKSNNFNLNISLPLTDQEIEHKFNKVDHNGRRYYSGVPIFCSRSMGARPNLCYEWRGFKNPYPSGWRLSKQKLEEEYQKGNIVIKSLRGGGLERRKYLDDYIGKPMDNNWTDIPRVLGRESVDYPTQKPLKLLERIIKASSNKGDVVLDPFCGCATSCVTAETLERRWVGIDISPKAQQLVKTRLNDTKQLTLVSRAWKFTGRIIQRSDIPARTDMPVKPKHNYKQMRRMLFKEQAGRCALCRTWFEERHFEIDHFYPKSQGGVDSIENRQLLCSSCNRIKGDKSMEEAIAIVRQRDLIRV